MNWHKLNSVVPFILIVTGFFLIYSRLITGGSRSKTNQAYIRVTVCLASVSPTKRTPDYVKYCYKQAEIDSGSGPIKAYGDGR